MGQPRFRSVGTAACAFTLLVASAITAGFFSVLRAMAVKHEEWCPCQAEPDEVPLIDPQGPSA